MPANELPASRRHAFGVAERYGFEGYRITEPEEKAITASRNWTLAQIKPELRAVLQTAEDVIEAQHLTPAGMHDYLSGHPEYNENEKALFLVAANAMRTLLEARRKRARKETRRAKKA